MSNRTEPFVRVLGVLDHLPSKPADSVPLRDVLPGVWPTVGDLRELAAIVDGLAIAVRQQRVEIERLRAALERITGDKKYRAASTGSSGRRTAANSLVATPVRVD